MEVLVVPAFDVLRVMLPVAPCRELPELREMAPPFADDVSSTVDPAVMVKLPPVPLVASPTASVMDPPVPEAEEPVTTEMEPLVSELVPVDREIDPEEESVLVAIVLPVWISMTPDSLPLEPDAALDRMTLPEAPFVEAPLVMMMLPPSPAARSVSPAFHVKSAPPVPPLLPKVMVREPAAPLVESPVLSVMSPASLLASPVSIKRFPELKPPPGAETVSPVLSVMPPVPRPLESPTPGVVMEMEPLSLVSEDPEVMVTAPPVVVPCPAASVIPDPNPAPLAPTLMVTAPP